MVASACSPGTWETQVGGESEFMSSLGYLVHSDHPGLQIETLSELWNLVMDSMQVKLPIAHCELWASPRDHQGFEPLTSLGLTQCLAFRGLSGQMLQCNDCLVLPTQSGGRWQALWWRCSFGLGFLLLGIQTCCSFPSGTRYKWWKWLKGILVSHFWRRKGFVLAGSFRRGEDAMKGREPGGGSSKMGDHTLSPHRKQRERGQEVRQAIQLQSQLQVA